MSRDANGNFTLPAGNPVISGTAIEATWANPTMTDLGNEITNSLSRTGKGGMLAPLKMPDGSTSAPALTFSGEATSGLHREALADLRMSVTAQDVMRWTAAGVDVWNFIKEEWSPLSNTAGFPAPVVVTDVETIAELNKMYAVDMADLVTKTVLIEDDAFGDGDWFMVKAQNWPSVEGVHFLITTQTEEWESPYGVTDSDTRSIRVSANGAYTVQKIAGKWSISDGIGEGNSALPFTELQDEIDAIANPNLLINGDFSVWQRGTTHSSVSNESYTADRILIGVGGTSPNVYSGGGVFDGTNQSLAIDGVAGNTDLHVNQRIENINCQSIVSGDDVTVSFETWCNSGVSNKEIYVTISRANGYNDWVTEHEIIQSDSVFVSDGYNSHSHTLNIPSQYFGEFGTMVRIVVLGGLDTGETIAFGNFKMELGAKSTPFVPDDAATNLVKCQRYYEVWTGFNVGCTNLSASGYTFAIHNFKVTKRIYVSPSKITYVEDSGITSMNPTSVTPDSFRTFTNAQHTITNFTVDAEL